MIDQQAEDIVFAELERLHDAGARFTAVSEERGVVDFGDDGVLVVIDPIDGSMNAKRGLTHHALSIAVADGPTMADVRFGYVFDLGPGEEWRAEQGAGAFARRRAGAARSPSGAPATASSSWSRSSRPTRAGSRRPRTRCATSPTACARWARSRSRSARSPPTRVDGMATLWKSRAVDCAAAQLIVRESGGLVRFPGMDDPLGAPLDLEPRAPVVAARTQEALEELAGLPTT